MLSKQEKIVGKAEQDSEGQEPPILKFNIKARYNELNLQQQRIFKKQFHERFGGNQVTFHNRLSTENLLADELIFFAAIFDCKVQELYSIPPKLQTSIFELYRKSKPSKPGIQTGLGV